MIRYLPLLFLTLTLSSCATLFNTRTEKINIVTSEKSTVVVNNIPTQTIENRIETKVPRSGGKLELIVSSDSLTKNVSVKPYSSFMFWANLGVAYGVGMIIDWKNPKRYSYPTTVYIDMTNKNNEYVKVDVSKKGVKNLMKITPLKLIGTSNPGLQLAYERKHTDKVSTQIMLQHLFSKSPIVYYNGLTPQAKGFRVSLEERFYHLNASPVGGYFAIEANYMQKQSKDLFAFSPIEQTDLIDDSLSYNDTITIKKQSFSINFKVGKQWIKNKLVFDLYVGFGLRYKDVKHFDRFNEDHFESFRRDHFPDPAYISNIKGGYWTVSMPLNFKIGYTF